MHSFFNLEIDHMFNLTFNGDLMFNFVYLLFFLIFGGYMYTWGFPCDSKSKKKKKNCNAGDLGSMIPGSGRSPGVGNGNTLKCSCQGNSMDRGAWWAIVHGVAKSQT